VSESLFERGELALDGSVVDDVAFSHGQATDEPGVGLEDEADGLSLGSLKAPGEPLLLDDGQGNG